MKMLTYRSLMKIMPTILALIALFGVLAPKKLKQLVAEEIREMSEHSG